MEEFKGPSKRLIKHLGYRVLIAGMLAALFMVVVPNLLGCRFDAVQSGSMSPALDAGDLAVTLPLNPYDIKLGDMISYRSPADPETLVIHRVVGIDRSGPLTFRTKGDANSSIDAHPVPAQAVVGKVGFQLPWLGYLVAFVQSTAGFILLLAVPGAVILYLEMNKLLTALSPKRADPPSGETRGHPSSQRRNPAAFGLRPTFSVRGRGRS